MRRLPSVPPVLPGFSHVRILGSGGFADVFLYEQHMPRRQVAVKVMLAEHVDDTVRRMFQAEADLMAQLSSHPAVLTVHQAGVAADGRPFLVMERCSTALGERVRGTPLAVAEALRIGVAIGSAVETAHRSGVLHRDLKPSNILLTAYGHPVLSDFGIAATRAEAERANGVGLSVPWSAPEVVQDLTAGTVASEVWSLAATVWTLLAGRSPFEVPGGDNTTAALMDRIRRDKPAPLGRDDVPPALERLLRTGLAKTPGDRPESALALVRGLQAVENDVGLPQTPAEIAVEAWATERLDDEGDRTRPRGAADLAVLARRRRRTGGRATASGSPPPEGTAQDRHVMRRPTVIALAASVTALVLVLAVLVAGLLRPAETGVPVVGAIDGAVVAGVAAFRWADPGLGDDDEYQVTTSTGGTSVQRAAEYRAELQAGETLCITVAVIRDGRPGAASPDGCVTG